MQLKEQLNAAVELFIDSLFERIESEVLKPPKECSKDNEKILSAVEVCRYYGFSLSTLRRHEQNGLARMNKNLKNKNRMFKLSTCENYFNSKKKNHELFSSRNAI